MFGRFLLFAVLAVALVAEVLSALSLAADGEFPYHVSLRIKGLHRCSGALFGDRFVVTSAKCVMDVRTSDILVITSSVSNIIGGESYAPRSVVINPDFERGTLGPNDIAIIVLEKTIHPTDMQHILTLPSHHTPSGVDAILTGWRWLPPDECFEMEDLMKLRVKTKECPASIDVGPQQICASVESGSDECMPDIGGPLVSNGELIGISSYGNPCDEGTSSAFTSVFHHIKWIFRTIAES